MSSEASNLLKAQITGKELILQVTGKNYYSDCRTLSQVVDMELYLAIGISSRSSKLHIGKGKHRTNNVITNPDDKIMSLPFPRDGGSIPDDFLLPDEPEEKFDVSTDLFN